MVWIRIPHFSGVGPLTEGNNPPPGITLNSPANNTNYTTNTNITINFTATDIGPYTNFTCNITINGVVNISNIIAFNATPQVNVTTIANDAIYLWNVTCKDLQNNTNTSNVTRTFYVDTHGPSFDTAYFTLKNISSYTPSASSLFWMVVNWTDAVKDVASAVLYFNGAAVNSTASVTDGVKVNLSYTIPVTVNGTYNVSMWANDTLGWSNQTQNITITVQDITPPSVTLSEPVNGYNISSSNLTFTFSVSDYGSALMDCNLTINGTRIISFNDTTGNTTVVTGLANNVYYYNLTCIDDAGNVNNTLLNRVFTVDTVPPAGAPNITVTNLAGNMNLTWTTDSNAMRYGVYKSLSNITDANNATWIANTTATSYIDNLTTNATSYWYVVTSIDFAGNENRSLVNVTLGRNNATSSDTTIPKVPASITVTNSSNTATIYWANVTLDGSGNADYTGMQFKLWYKSGSTINLSNNASNNSMSLHTTVSPNSTTFSIPSSCGSSCVYTFAVTTLDDGSNENQTLINGSNMATVTLTYTNTSSSSTTTSSSSSSTTTPTTTPTDVIAKVSKAWSVLSADAETKMNVLNEKIPFEAVTFTLNAKSNNPSIDVSSINKPSTLATAPGAAYSYLKIDTKNLDDTLIKNAKVQFKVKLSWFTENNVKRNTIKLYRYTTTWTALETKELTVDNTYAYFEATLPGFSYFAISGIKTETAEESAPEVSTDEGTSLGSGQNHTAGEAGKDEKKGEQKQIQLSSTLWLWIGAAAVIIIALAIFFFMGKREVSVSEGKEEVKEQEKDINEIIDYISKESSKGIPRKSIERALLAKGWKIEAIKDAFNKSGKE
jgi:PGF-pre-PGF domain-containing protein